MSFKNYYNILGVQKDASPQEIKTAFKKLSLKFHPDKNDNDVFLSEMFKNVNEAYQVLSDDNKRELFNKQLEEISSTSNQINDDELQILNKLINNYQQKKEIFEAKKTKYNSKLNQKPKKQFFLSKILFSTLLLVLSYFILKPEYSKVVSKSNRNFNRDSIWTTVKQTNIFNKTDEKSKIIGTVLPNKKIKSNIDTLGFVKIYFINKDKYLISGFVKSTDLVKRNKKDVLLTEIIHPKLVVNNPEKTTEIYKIIVEHNNNYDILSFDWDYIIKSKSDYSEYKYSIENKTITEFKTVIDLNIEAVISKLNSFGFIYDESSKTYKSKNKLNSNYIIELEKINYSKTKIIYKYFF